METVFVKLCSGEEVFAKIVATNGDMITLDLPMIVYKQYDEIAGQVSINLNFEPFCSYVDGDNLIIDRKHIMVCEPLKPRLVELYQEMKSSLVKPPKGQTVASRTLH